MTFLYFALVLAFAVLAIVLVWPRERACQRCEGKGWIIVYGEDSRWRKTETCPRCQGRRTES